MFCSRLKYKRLLNVLNIQLNRNKHQHNDGHKMNHPLLDVFQNKQSTSSTIKSDWNDTLSNAERIVQYPTSFLSLKFLLKDEISNLVIHIRKLLATKHPVIETAK